MTFWNTVWAVVVGMLIYEVLDNLFIAAAIGAGLQ